MSSKASHLAAETDIISVQLYDATNRAPVAGYEVIHDGAVIVPTDYNAWTLRFVPSEEFRLELGEPLSGKSCGCPC